ncbi:MAG: class I mannose-6-phosphate isomerase [Flavobacteriaceae bacterium]|nr:class I mannose-6-phosphate isomerase [Flavobacteriaceae bacterium]
MSLFYPIYFIPQYQYRIWGGDNLKIKLNREHSVDSCGESWEISTIEGFESHVLNGSFAGDTLNSLIDSHPKEILGSNVLNKFGSTFPLLIKFLDTKKPLSVQVHPDDLLAKKRHNSFGKNEMWYIMDAKNDSELIVGFDKEIDENDFKKLNSSGKLEDVLHKEKISSDDVVYIPAGTIHGIGANILLAEIQQASNITYRVFDYDRVDSITGLKRDLHTDLAVDVLDFKPRKNIKTSYSKKLNEVNSIIQTPFFSTNYISLDDSLKRSYDTLESFKVLMCVKGNLKIYFENKEYNFPFGQTVYIPAAIREIEIKGTGSFLEVYI